MNFSNSSILLIFFVVSLSTAYIWAESKSSVLLDPVVLRPYMFQKQISGRPNKAIPLRKVKNCKGEIIREEYIISMVKTHQQILPPQISGKTTIYAYGAITETGFQASFPGPAIVATKNRQVKVTWMNTIFGPHILPVDYNYPFLSTPAFKNQVPVVPHVHGLAVQTSSDGQPEAYWTASGYKSSIYQTQQKTLPNSAVFIYPNQQQAGNLWYHDHAFGITRLNVYAGLAGLYKIVDSCSQKQYHITNKYGPNAKQDQTKFLVVTDKSFYEDGSLYYNEVATNPKFTSWVPEFFGNTMLVNGVLWPKMTLKNDKHRFVLLNACQSRFLNIWFQNNGNKIPFDLIRIDTGFYNKPVTVTEFLFTISARVEFILDLTNIQGQVIMKNDAQAPFPMGDPENLDSQFTGQIMKFIVQKKPSTCFTPKPFPMSTEPFPKFSKGEKVFTTLLEIRNEDGDPDGAFIDGISMETGMDCPNSTYTAGKTYDFYLINLTPDAHPIHIHLIHFQKIKQYPFNVDAYSDQYYSINGGKPDYKGFATAPISLDPEPYRTGPYQPATDTQKVFRDSVDALPGYVTVIRVKFARYDGQNFTSFDMKGQRYVMHCHILEHEDNQMMKYFCLK